MLKVVENNLPEPPYSPETFVRGWRFQIDHERLNQSDTWAIAPDDMRPWLLMLWNVAWQQRPAGAFSNNDHVIAAKIGMDVRLFLAHKDILMRGWVLHADGRLYHPVIVEQVQSFQEHNRKERERVAAWRAKKKEESNARVTSNKRVSTTPEPEPEPNTSSLRSEVVVPSDDGTCETAEGVSTPRPDIPYAKILALWAEICPNLPQPVKLSKSRRSAIAARWRDELPDLDAWRECFTHVSRSKFLSGGVDPPPGRRRFEATLDWIVKQENLLKLYEGRYDNG